jgi:rubrerythrin
MDQSSDLLDALIQHEKNVSDLYKSYAERIELLAGFWNSLSREELQHAQWIQRLGQKIQDQDVFLNKKRISLQAVQTSMRFINAQIVRTKRENLTAIQMLSTALDIEKAMIEKSFFDLFEGDSPEIKNTLSALATETKKHIEKIQAMWMKYR